MTMHLRTARHSGAAAFLLVFATMAAGRAEGARLQADTGPSLHRSVTRYPVAVAPVVEDLATAARRDRETRLSRPPMMTSQRCPEIDEPALSGRDGSSPARSAPPRGRTPLFLATPSPLPDLQFDTNPFSNLNRPDSAIAAGPSHLVTAVNFAFQVQDLDGGNAVATGVNSFFPGDPTHSVGDPRLSYDQATGRFIMSWLGFDYPGTNEPPSAGDSFCDVAVSATSDPRGAWNKYTFHVLRGTEQMDFDSLGYDGKAIYVTARMRDFANNTQFSGNRILILDKAKALAGQALAPLVVDDLVLPGGGLAEIIKPVESAEPVTATSPAYFLCAQGSNAVALYTLTDPLGSPAFAGVQIPIPGWQKAGLAPQAGGLPDLGQEAGTPLHKTVIRDGVIWSCQSPSATGVANERSGVVVYKIDAAAGTLLESHAISDPSIWYYLPAVVPDLSGNAVVVFAGSDATHFAGIYYARYVAALGDFEAPALAAAGSTNFSSSGAPQSEEAWGDYLDAATDVASGNREIWIHGELPATATTWKMHAARIPSTSRPIIGVSSTSLQYGTVCVGETKDLTLTVSNSGTADLNVASILRTSGSSEFSVAGGAALPTTIAPGGHADYTIRFAPSLPAGSRTATFRVASDDPLTPTVDVATAGTVSAIQIGATTHLAFPPTVIGGTCFTQLPVSIQNTGTCNLTINAVGVIGADASEFSLVGLPPGGFPVTLTPGQSLGSGLAVQFRPGAVRFHQAQIAVTYVSDPGAQPPATSAVTIPVYGEGVNTGARVLVTLNGVPVSEVEKLHLQLADPSRNGGNEVTHDLPLVTVVGPTPELTYQYHREWGGASNPEGLPPDDYKITVTIRVGNKRQTQTVFFTVTPCGFANVHVNFL